MAQLLLDEPRVVDEYLVCGYRFFNDGARPLYLRCLIADAYGLSEDLHLDRSADEGAAPTPELAYVTWAAAGHAVFLQGTAPPAAGASQPIVPLAVRVDSGGRFRAAIRSRLPLVEWHGHLAPFERPTKPAAIERVTLIVECAKEVDAGAQPHRPLVEAWHTKDDGLQRFAAEARLREPIVLLRRSDEVPRIPVSAP